MSVSALGASLATSAEITPGALLESEATAEELEGQIVAFWVERQLYGIELAVVREIRAWSGVTPLPGTPHHMRGVINLRGTILPVLDLRAHFGLGLTEPGEESVVIVMRAGGRWIGVLVDAVLEIFTAEPGSLGPVPDAVEVHSGLLKAIATHQDRMVGLVDPEMLLPRRNG